MPHARPISSARHHTSSCSCLLCVSAPVPLLENQTGLTQAHKHDITQNPSTEPKVIRYLSTNPIPTRPTGLVPEKPSSECGASSQSQPTSIFGYLLLWSFVEFALRILTRTVSRFTGNGVKEGPATLGAAVPVASTTIYSHSQGYGHFCADKPSRLSICSIESQATKGSNMRFSPPGSAFTTESSYEDSQLLCQWTTMSRSNDDQDFSHKVLAKGVALFNWSGSIPGRTTHGFRSKEGREVEICAFINKDWIMVHDVTCKYLPLSFVRVLEKTDNARHPQTIERELRGFSNDHAPIRKLLTRPLLGHLPFQGLIRAAALPLRMTSQTPRPPVPPAPFPREPCDQIHDGNRVLIETTCRKSRQGSGTILGFTFTMVPEPQTRFTALSFDVQLPKGQKIVGTVPERAVSGRTEIQQTGSKGHEVDLGVSGGYMGSSLRLGYKSARFVEAEYSRSTKSEIRGGGRSSDRATWTATEDIAAGSGLDHKLKFAIMLPTDTPPQSVSCHYKLRVAKQREINTKDKSSKFSHSWKIDFTPEAFGSEE